VTSKSRLLGGNHHRLWLPRSQRHQGAPRMNIGCVVKSDRLILAVHEYEHDACEPRASAPGVYHLAAQTLCWPRRVLHLPPARHITVPAAAPVGHVTPGHPWSCIQPWFLCLCATINLLCEQSMAHLCIPSAAKPVYVDRLAVRRCGMSRANVDACCSTL
jgi:hypothetical protein